MNISMTTDFARSRGKVLPFLERIAGAGFTHVHWCQHWDTDRMYSNREIAVISKQLKKCGLKLTDLHGTPGKNTSWGAFDGQKRRAGVALVKNRINMAAELGSDTIIMHVPAEFDRLAARPKAWPCLYKSLDELIPFAAKMKIRIAIENGEFGLIEKLLHDYPADFLGLCYDCGHGNISGSGLEGLEKNKARLISIHLHDNDGKSDLHMPLFTGTVNWPRLGRIIASSSYKKWASLETGMWNSEIKDEKEFLKQAYAAGIKFWKTAVESR